MKRTSIIPLLLGVLLFGASCVAPHGAPPKPPKPPKPPGAPHGAIQIQMPDSTFSAPVVALR
jgi:hypothetical protein